MAQLMEHYVTLFDSLFLPQALALHGSMQRHAGAYRLWMLCMDKAALLLMRRLDLPNVGLLCLADWRRPSCWPSSRREPSASTAGR